MSSGEAMAITRVSLLRIIDYVCNNLALWASLFRFIENDHDQPKMVAKICSHLLPLLNTVVANNVSLYILCGNLHEITYCLTRTKWSSPDTVLVRTFDTFMDDLLTKLSNTVA